MKKKLFLMIAVLCCMLLLVATLAACADKGDTGENPGGDVTENPGGDNPGGENPDPGEIEVFKMVSFDMNGGEGQIADMNFKVGAVMAALPVPNRDGYKFICWVDDISEEEYTAESVMPNNDLRLKAKWEKIISGYSDDFVSFKPSSEGVKDTSILDLYRNEVDKFVYVEISSDDLGGVENVGKQNNFTLRTLEGMQYAVQPGYSWTWYQGDFDTPNGAQRFTLDYGSNIQFVTISDSSGVVRQTYLLDIYVKHDYYVYLYKNIFEQSPYNKVRVIENDCFDQDAAIYESPKFEFDSRVYYNETTGTYEKFVYSTVIKKDWNLYQTYKPVTFEAELNEGTLDNDLVITPYTQYFTLPSAQKNGFDFIGWKLADDRFITNIQGYSGTNYLSEENCPDKLIADFEAKKNYYTFDGTELKTVKTVPTVIYTDNTMSEIFDIVYTPYNTDCVLPTKVPYDNNNIFKEWSWYYKNSNGEFSKYFSAYNFNKKITEPLALVPTMESCNDNVIPLNQTVTSSGYKTYKMYLPVAQIYTLKVTTTGNVKFTTSLQEGSTQGKHTYTVTSSGSPTNISLRCYVYNYGSQVTTFGYVGLTVDSYSGTYSFTLIGDTAQSEGNPVVTSDENTASVGEEFTVQLSKPGYAFAGWYKDGIEISDTEFLTMEEEESTYTAEWIECPVTIEKSINEAGTVSGIPETTFVGQEIMVTATSKPGYTWVGWYNGETLLTGDLSYTFNMPEQDITYTAKWIKVTVNKSTSNAGSVTALNSTYKVGDSVTITATTNSGYTWVGWFNGDTELTKEQSYTFNMPAENLTYTAKWIKVTVNKSTSNAGSVTALNSTYKVGDSVTITATTNSGYTWLGWYNGEEELTKDASYTFTMPSENVQYTAKWAAYTVTTRTEDSSAGSVTYMNAVKTRAGDEVTITATPRTGYTFVGWYEDDTLISTDLVYTFSMPAKSIIYSAKWTYYTLTTGLNDADAGSISVYTAQKISVGQSVTIEAETNNGYTFLGWYNGEILLSADAIYTFDMPAEDIVYTARWTAYSLTVEITEGGCLDTSYAVVSFNLNDGTGSVLSEQQITDSIGLVYPDFPTRSGYAFAGWYDNADCTGLPFDFSATVYADTMLYARWIPYTGTGVVSINSQTEVSVVSKSSSNKVYYAFVPLSDGTITLYTTGSLDTYGYLYDSNKKQLKTNDDDGDGNNFKITYNVTAGTLYYVSPCGYSSSGITTLHVAGAIPEAGGKFYGEDIDWQAGHIATAGTVIRFCVVTNSGYTFAGWYKDGELVSRDLDYNFTMLSENVVLTAKWIECPVTLEKNMDEAGSVSGLESPVVVGENVTITASTNNGYTWLGWYAGDSLLTSEPSYTFAMPSENVQYTAKWAEYILTIQTESGTVTGLTDATVSFDLNGGEGEIAPQSVTESNPLSYPEIPSREGYVFKGWYIDKECTVLYDFTQSLSYNITLYAGWHAMTDDNYYSRQVINIVEDNNSSSNYLYFSTVETSQSKKVYTYFTALTGGEYTVYVKNSTQSNPNGVVLEIINSTKNSTIQEKRVTSANYIGINFTADAGDVICISAYRYNTSFSSTFYIYVEGGTYPEAGGLPLNTSSLSVEAGQEITLKAANDSGYTWLGWYNGSEKLSDDTTYTFNMPHQSITLTPKWAKYTLTIQSEEGGSVSYDGFVPDMYPITAGESVTIIAETDSGYIWLGWFDGDVKVSDDAEFTFAMPNHSVCYTGKWTYYTVTTNSNYEDAGTYTIKENEKVTPGEKVVVSASTNSGFTWIGWFDGDKQLTDELIYTFIMPETSVVYTAKWSKVSLEKNIVDAGTITGLDGNYVVGESVTIAVKTNDGYAWLGWYNGEEELSKDLSYTMTMSDSDLTITAKWIKITFESDDPDAGSVNPITGNNKVGDEYTAVATTKPGYTFVGWYEDDRLLSEELQYTFSIPSNDVTYTAKWIKVNIEKNIENAGTVTSLTGTYLIGDEASVVATSESGYTWLGWYIGDELITTNFELNFEMPNNAVTYTAQWIICPVTVTLNDENAGTYSGLDGNVINSEVALKAQTNAGYTWVGWYTGDELLTDSLTYTFNITTEEIVLTAKWVKTSLSKNMPEAGEVTQLDSTYKVGDSVIITAQTNTGYTWVGWYEGDMLLTNEAEYSFEMTEENHIYTAKWIKIDLNVNNALAGTVTGLSDAYKVGDNATVTAASNSGYIWVGWYNGEELLTRAKEYTFSMPSESATYTASWIKITLNKNISAGGTVSGLEGDDLSYGDNTVVTATSNLGYEWLGWYNGDELVSSSNEYSFIIGDNEMTLTAKWEVKPEMAMFVFSSSDSYCSITGVKEASSVTAVHIPSYVTDVSSSGFKNCHDIATITAEAGNARYRAEGNCLIDSNYDRVVLGCKNSVIPTSSDVTSIGEAAFFARYGLISIVIPKNIISMSASSPDVGQFAYCEDLTSVEWKVDLNLGLIPDHLPNIFMGCTELSRFTMTGSNSRYYTVDNCIMYRPTAWGQADNELILAINPSSIPAAASVISSNAFVLCSEMTSLVVPDTVKKIEQGAFSGMSGLNEITVPFVGRDADAFTAGDRYSGPYLFGYVFGTKSYDDSTAVVQYGINQDPAYKYTYYMPKGLTKVTLTNGMVENNGFNNWKNLKELVGVVRLGHGALRNCTGITSIDLSNCQSIDSLALSGTSITTVTVPKGCTVSSGAFEDCKQLKSVVWNDDSIGDSMFKGCSALQSVTLTNNLTWIGNSAFEDCKALQSITLPDSLTRIGDSAFYGCSSLTSIVIPANVTYVGGLAFGECSKLNSVTFKDTNNWVRSKYNSLTVSGAEYREITVNDPSQNADNLTDISNSTNGYWYTSGWGRTFWIKVQD